MPLVRHTLLRGKSEARLAAMVQAVHETLVECYDMDDRDRFQIVNEVEPGRLVYSKDYAGGPRSDDFVVIEVISMPRTAEVKEAFYGRLVERLAGPAGFRPEDVFVILSDQLAMSDISFANGVSAAALAARYRPSAGEADHTRGHSSDSSSATSKPPPAVTKAKR